MLELLVGAFLGSSLTKKYSNMTQEEIQEDLINKATTISKVASAGANIISNKVLASKEDIKQNKHNTNHDELVDKMFNKDSDKDNK